VAQRIGNLHVAAAAPERRVLPIGDFVVEDDEVADVLDLRLVLLVVLVDIGLADTHGRKHLQQAKNAALDQVDAGRFQGFEKTAGQADRDTISVPGLATLARLELDDPGFGQRLALDLGLQELDGALVVQVLA
jgi:hypothetical protein